VAGRIEEGEEAEEFVLRMIITWEDVLNRKTKKYRVILADPPWKYWAGGDKNAAKHYECMELEDIRGLPVKMLSAKDSVLFMWTTAPMLEDSFGVINSWGFKYSTMGFAWVKKNKSGQGYFTGLGNWTRKNLEYCLLALKGSPEVLKHDVHELIVSPLREHSRKPDEQYERIERLLDGPYLEIFARTVREGWDVLGYEVETSMNKRLDLCLKEKKQKSLF